MSSTHLWDWPGPPWTSARAPPSNGCVCQKDGRHDSSVLSPAVPRVALSAGTPTPLPNNAALRCPPKSNSLLRLLSLDITSHSPPSPMASTPFISLTLKERKGTALFTKYVCNFFFLFFLFSFFLFLSFFLLFFFAECACAIHIDII